MKTTAPLALLLLAGCSAAGDPYAPREGQWEVTTSFVTIDGPGVTPERVAQLRKSFEKPLVEKTCFDGEPDKVGDTKMAGRCTVTRISDTGAKVDNEWRCQQAGKPDAISTVHGTQGPDRYDHRISTDSFDAQNKGTMTVVTREQGRRIGECPKS